MSKIAITVDDSKTIRDMVAFTLRSNGFEVFEAEDGVKGLSVLQDLATQGKKINLIITDLNMPNMDGIEMIKNVRINDNLKEPFKFTPILMLTTESDDSKKQMGREAGATGWIVKPFNPEKLMNIVVKVCP
jgi:two-component system, chemotaxis family, chemotaxis protein CheY